MGNSNDPVEIELRSCFVQIETGDVIQVLGAIDTAHLFAIYKGSPGYFEWCADFQDKECAHLFANALELHLKSQGFLTINRALNQKANPQEVKTVLANINKSWEELRENAKRLPDG